MSAILRFSPFFLIFPLLASCASVDSKDVYSPDMAVTERTQSYCEKLPVENIKTRANQGLNPENIAFLNWNIYKGDGENWQKDLSAFAKSHDVMTIQEAYLDDELTGLLTSNELNWSMNKAFYLSGYAAGVMTAAKSNATHSCGFKIKEPIIRVPKSTLVSYYSIKGFDKQLLVANIHGINFTLGMETYREQMQQLFSSIESHDGPMIVAGDFNSWSDERMDEVDRLVNKLALSSLDYPVNNKTHVFGNAIDHVFYRQLEPVSNQVWQVTSSDHNPISVNFRLQKNLYSSLQ